MEEEFPIVEVPVEQQPELINLFENSSVSERRLLIQLFGTEFFPLDITERIISFEAACVGPGFDPAPINDLVLPTGSPFSAHAYIKLVIIIRALNGNWEADLNNANQRKYHLIPTVENGKMIYTATSYITTSTPVPQDLLLVTEEMAKHLANTFAPLLKEYYWPFILEP